MEGAKSRPELLPCETVVCGVRGIEVPPPSPRGVMKLMSSNKDLLMWLTFNKTKFLFNNIEPEIRIQRICVEDIPKPIHLRLGT